MLDCGYLFGYFDGLNRFYVRREDESRLQYLGLPPSVFDNFVPHYHTAAVASLAENEVRVEEAKRCLREEQCRATALEQTRQHLTASLSLATERLAQAHGTIQQLQAAAEEGTPPPVISALTPALEEHRQRMRLLRQEERQLQTLIEVRAARLEATASRLEQSRVTPAN